MFIKNTYAANNDTISIKENDELVPVPESSTQSTLISFVPMILIFVVFYFFLIRPQDKRRREKELIVASLKKGEEVITNSGIFGVVNKINDTENTVDLEISENVKIKMLKSSILDITSRHKTETINSKKNKEK